jgi:hypothetical protein
VRALRTRLLLPSIPRYNRGAVISHSHSRFALALFLLAATFWAASCATSPGPGYTVEKQQIRVQFVSAPEPRIRVEADYQLRNTGNQPLHDLELRLPGRRRFHYQDARASWDAVAVTAENAKENPRNSVIALPEPWTTLGRHTLHLAVEYSPPAAGKTGFGFTNDAFYLPAQGWSPELLPPSGLFASGGVPPRKWELRVSVPESFLVHTSGEKVKSSRSRGEVIVRAIQRPKDQYPFVIAGRYVATTMGGGKDKVFLWTRTTQESAALRPVSDALVRTIEAYDAAFGSRSKDSSPTWIVECPAAAGCFTSFGSTAGRLFGEEENRPTSAEMISSDAMVVDLSGGTLNLAAMVAPSLASSWLGYGQNPGYYEQDLPLSLLPAFAATTGREAAAGAESRTETIRRSLRLIPAKTEPRQQESENVLRAKSFLFFYALEDKYGKEVFQKAIGHMLYARRERGFELSDLIAAFEQETHQNVAEFVRLWMKRPGVPEEFRARYSETAAAKVHAEKETTP